MRVVTLAILAGLLAGADTREEQIKRDLAQIQGEWAMVSGEREGRALPEEFVKTARRVCKGDETTAIINGEIALRAKFTLDPTKKPKTIDYHLTGGPNKGLTQLGIYELDGDTLRFCQSIPGEPRPTEFSAKAGSGCTMTVWKRSKKK
jgi:uncharacterized protein (TIGR03067 family)